MLISLFCGCCVKSRCWVLSNAEHPHGAARGAAVGVLSCYLDNIEITQAKRETLLFACPFLLKVLKKETGPIIIRVCYYT